MDATMIITQIFLPISLAIIMFGMGLSLVISDFSRLFTYPKAVLTGLLNQLIFLPLIGFTIILLFDLSHFKEKCPIEARNYFKEIILKLEKIEKRLDSIESSFDK